MVLLIIYRYADQYLAKVKDVLKPSSRFSKWKKATNDEIRAFLALLLAMGLVEQLDIQEYWTTHEVTSTPFFKTVMPRDRFLLLFTFLHFNDNDNYIARGQEGYDPLYKLGKMNQLMTKSFSDNPANHCYCPAMIQLIPSHVAIVRLSSIDQFRP